jgi:FtsZ-interacting cell division protein ZipA
MNSLQAGLIAVSVFVIALFAAWMWWQSWRNHRRNQAPKPTQHATVAHKTTPMRADSVLGDEFDSVRTVRRDPKIDGDAAPIAARDSTAEFHDEIAIGKRATESIEVDDFIDEAPQSAHGVNVERTAISSHDRDAMHDHSAMDGSRTSHGASPIGAEAAHHAPKTVSMPTTLPLDDRLNLYATIAASDGQAIDCQEFAPLADRSLAWGRVFRLSAWEYIEDLSSGGAVQALCLGAPIASRAGPMQDADALDWKRSVSAIADQLQLNVAFGGDVGVGARATELDQFLAAADVICVLYLVRKDSGHWSGTRLRGTLEANGFRLQADGRFVYFEVESESPIFSAVDGFERSFTPERLRTENVTALRLVFEASNVVNPVARFDVYRQTLRALARLLEADIKDSSGANVGDDEFAALRADVLAGSTALAEAGIECGSPAARALFR